MKQVAKLVVGAWLLGLIALESCGVKTDKFESTSVPAAPDYGNLDFWAAHPDKTDLADTFPAGATAPAGDSALADVFFLHPTTYTTRKAKAWNANLSDAELNAKTDATTILHQASIFNAAGRVYAPRYRQAHLQTFFTDDEEAARRAFEIAYSDLANAFAYYLEHWNNGRPIIIAAHSQGARHAIRLLKEFFDEKPLRQQLVVAYLVGWPVEKNAFATIPPCQTPSQTGCFCSWRSFKYGYLPKRFPAGDHIAVVNPLTWRTDTLPADKQLNLGTVLRKYDKLYPGLADAKVHKGVLWVHKPRFPGSIFWTTRNYHVADFNLFWANVRLNALERVRAFTGRQ